MSQPPAYDAEGQRTDDSLLFYAIEGAASSSPMRLPRWSHVGNLFGLGSTSANLLCKRFGIDPNELVGGCTTCECSESVVCECNAKDYGL